MAAKYPPTFASAAADYITPHDPKNLPQCYHMCRCLCLRKMTKDGLKAITCPQCNKVSNLPDEGVDGLITCLAIRNLARKHPDGIKQHKDQMRDELEQLQKQNDRLLENEEDIKEQIKASIDREVKVVEKTIEAVMTQGHDMIRQIKDFGLSSRSQAEENIGQMKQHKTNIEQLQNKLKRMANQEFQTQIDSIVDQIEKLKVNETPASGVEECFPAKFVAGEVHLGRVVKPLRLDLVHEFGEFGCAAGIAFKPASGFLAVVDAQCDHQATCQKVFIYRRVNSEYEKSSQFKVEHVGSNEILEIAVSFDGKNLLATRGAGVEAYSAVGHLQKTIKVPGIRGQPKQNVESISVTTISDGRILVGSEMAAGREEPDDYFITVHDRRGNIIKKVPTNHRPARIVDVNGTHVAIGNFEEHVYVYDLQTGNETIKFDIPMPVSAICYHEKSDCLLIRRATKKNDNGKMVCGSCVIEQYCRKTGTLAGRLAQGLHGPLGMTISRDGMLAVADFKTVKVYTME